jgi:hypothetical protein
VTHTVSRGLVAVAVAVAGRMVAGFEPTLDTRSVAEAIAVGQSRIEAQRVKLHQQYRIAVARPPVDYLEVVTPFRRVAMAAEAAARAGNRIWGQREAFQTLADASGRLDLVVELTFHPLNTYLGVPAYDARLEMTGTAPIAPIEIQRVPRFGPRVEGMPPSPSITAVPMPPAGSQPLLGGTVIAVFDGARLKPRGVYDAVVSEAGKELARAGVNLGSLR